MWIEDIDRLLYMHDDDRVPADTNWKGNTVDRQLDKHEARRSTLSFRSI